MPVLRVIADGIARLTLNRPEKRNALDADTVAALTEALSVVAADDSVRVVTLTGAGKDFCAGADLEELRVSTTAPAVENLDNVEALVRLFSSIREIGKPVVALVHGRALAGGCGLATVCDLVLAERSARFGYTEVQIGFVPAIVTAILRRNLSEKRAFELLTTGDLYSARDFERLGLVNRVFPDAGFYAAADEFVRKLADRSATALRLTKRHLYAQESMSFDAALRAGATLNVLARTTEDTRAGITRFLEERATRRSRE